MKRPLRRLLATLFALAATVLGGAIPVSAIDRTHVTLVHRFNAGQPDDRQSIPRSALGRAYAPFGIIRSSHPIPANDDGSMLGTAVTNATLISPCYILTNYHAVYGLNLEPPKRQKSYYNGLFSVGSDGNGKFLHSNILAMPVAHGNYAERPLTGEDWALLKLTRCVGGDQNIGWIEIAHKGSFDFVGRNLIMIGSNTLNYRMIVATKVCRIREFRFEFSFGLNHDCTTDIGNSAFLGVFRNSDHHIVAVFMNQGFKRFRTMDDPKGENFDIFDQWSADKTNLGVDIVGIMQFEAFDQVRMDIKQFGHPNPSQSP